MTLKNFSKIQYFFRRDPRGFATIIMLVVALVLSGLSMISGVPVFIRWLLAVWLWLVLADWLAQGIKSLFSVKSFPFFWLGFVAVPYLFGTLLAPFLLWWRFVPWQVVVVSLAAILIASAIRFVSFKPPEHYENDISNRLGRDGWIIIALSLAVLGLAIISRTPKFFLSLWDVTHPLLPAIILLLLWFIGRRILREAGLTTLRLVIIVSLAIHLLFPIIYEVGFSGDRWRHLATVQQLATGQPMEPVLFGDHVSVKQIGPWLIPEVLLVGNKQSYVTQWAFELYAYQVLGLPLLALDQWFMPIIWSLAIPLLLWLMGSVLEFSERGRLLLAFSPLMAAPFFVYGGATLPKAFGFLPFLFFFILGLARLGKQHSVRPKKVFILGILLSWLAYVPYAIMLIIMGLYIWLAKKIKQAWAQGIMGIMTAVGLALLFPLLDTLQKYSVINPERLAPVALVRALARQTWRFVHGQSLFSYPFAIEQENVWFTQAYTTLVHSSFLGNINWASWFAPVIIVLVISGAILLWRRDQSRAILLAAFGLGTWGAMLISAVGLDGNHIVSKRLVILTALFSLPLLVVGIGRLARYLNQRQVPYTNEAIAMFMAMTMLVSLTSGPRIQRVTPDELSAAQKINAVIASPFDWLRVNSAKQSRACVLANTWPLLALEAVSGGTIINGGFPLYPPEFSAPERVSLYELFLRNPSVRYLQRAQDITKSKTGCIVMLEKRFLKPYTLEPSLEPFIKLLGEPERVGEVAMWRWGGK